MFFFFFFHTDTAQFRKTTWRQGFVLSLPNCVTNPVSNNRGKGLWETADHYRCSWETELRMKQQWFIYILKYDEFL